jgi:hypothetical protein
MIPKSCKVCPHKCKGISRGSKKCKIKLGLIEDNKPIKNEWTMISILWYYYNESKGLYDKDKKT